MLADVTRTVADPLRLKLKAGIGEDAFTSLRLSNALSLMTGAGGAAAVGASIAASAPVAAVVGTSSGGLLAALGLGAVATTPVGWIVGAAVASGGVAVGILRLQRGLFASRVATIPKFLSTPIDILGAAILDALAPIAIKVVTYSGPVDAQEMQVILDYFITDWGLDPAYVAAALPIITDQVQSVPLDVMVKNTADLLRANPDCNYATVERDILALLHDLALADGHFHETEDMAIERVATLLRRGRPSVMSALRDGAASFFGRLRPGG